MFSAAQDKSTHDIQILFLMDHDYGANYHAIWPIMEGWGWNITIAGLDNPLTPCDYQNPSALVYIDCNIHDIEDITAYDAISIMPGESHANLLVDAATLELIQDAVQEGLVVSAWCRAVRVLAAAGVLDGVNITGNADYEAEYLAAGAIFNELVPPVIDGNIVTGVRSRFYRREMCEAIATALGVFEEDPPTLVEVSVNPRTPQPLLLANFTVEAADASGIAGVDMDIFPTAELGGERILYTPVVELTLTDSGLSNIYKGSTAELALGSYTVDVILRDIFDNWVVCEDAFVFEVCEAATATTNTTSTTTGALNWNEVVSVGLVVGAPSVIVVLVAIWRRKGAD